MLIHILLISKFPGFFLAKIFIDVRMAIWKNDIIFYKLKFEYYKIRTEIQEVKKWDRGCYFFFSLL